jgi:hypothetical protein
MRSPQSRGSEKKSENHFIAYSYGMLFLAIALGCARFNRPARQDETRLPKIRAFVTDETGAENSSRNCPPGTSIPENIPSGTGVQTIPNEADDPGRSLRCSGAAQSATMVRQPTISGAAGEEAGLVNPSPGGGFCVSLDHARNGEPDVEFMSSEQSGWRQGMAFILLRQAATGFRKR